MLTPWQPMFLAWSGGDIFGRALGALLYLIPSCAFYLLLVGACVCHSRKRLSLV